MVTHVTHIREVPGSNSGYRLAILSANFSFHENSGIVSANRALLLHPTILHVPYVTITEPYDGVTKSFRTESITKYKLTIIKTRWEATKRVMAAKLTRLTQKIAIQLHVVAESCNNCSSCSRRPVQKLLDTPSYTTERYMTYKLIKVK
jgi:hypothetical protein